MSNIYLKVAIATDVSKLRFSKFKKFVCSTVFGELQLMQIYEILKLLVAN